jgi:fimbrial chaperone protein
LNNAIVKTFCSALTVLTCSTMSMAGGIGLGTTRVIFPTNVAQVPLLISNTSTEDHFLINSWIEDQNEKKTNDLLITPPIYVSKPNSSNAIKINKIKEDFAQDRETLYYVNIKSVPSANKQVLENTNVLQLAVLSRIKLFIRPEGLKPIENIEQKIELKKVNNNYFISNPTPFYMNLVKVTVNGKSLNQGLTIKPLSDYPLENKNVSTVSFKMINDYGGLTETVNLKN